MVQVAFDSLGSLPMQKIRDVREVKQALVDGEMQKRENREKMRRSVSISSAPNTKASPVNGKNPLLIYVPAGRPLQQSLGSC